VARPTTLHLSWRGKETRLVQNQASFVGGMADKELYNLLGRGSPAGRALFNIYNGDSAGRRAGSEFHGRNKQAHERKLSKGWQPSESYPSTPPPGPGNIKAPKVAVPRVGRGTDDSSRELVDERGRTYFHYQLRYGGRKSKAEIIQEVEKEWANPSPQPASKRPLLDDKEKDRLATLMRWRGKPPEVALLANHTHAHTNMHECLHAWKT